MADETFPRRATHTGAGPTYTIFLRDFTAMVSVLGANEPRRARFNVRLTVAHPGAGFPDDIAAVMSYEDIVEDLRRLCAGPAVSGPEPLAEQAATLCLSRPKVRRVRVEVEIRSPGPDAAVSGVTVERERAANA